MAGQSPDGDRARVLVIDDEYGARLQVELALMTSTLARVAAESSNGMRGAEVAEQLQPDIIVLDLSMPLMDGFEALPLLRAVAPDAVILIRSNSEDPDAIQRALDLGGTEFLRKMLAPDELREAIERHVGARTPARRFLTSLRSPRGRRIPTPAR